jgi:cob(I)alamin adenosyltransferase
MATRRGLTHIYTGDGKGKTTAAVGLAVRAVGQGMKVLFVQFFKEDSASSGEKKVFQNLVKDVDLLRSNCRHPFFTGKATDDLEVRRAITETFSIAAGKAMSGGYGLVVLDEVMAAINGKWLELSAVQNFLDKRPASVEVALTGRDAPPELVKRADYVTEMLCIKHPFASGEKARKGIEF